MSQFLVNNAWLVPFLPLLGALIAASGAPWLGQKAHWPVIVGIGLAFVVALGLLTVTGPETTTVGYDWLTISGLHVPIEFRLDGLTTMMLAMVTFVSTLVAIFAAGYMAGDPGYPRFFACIGLFVFSMTGLVLSSNYLLTYVFWEGVGTCSYLLVGFWHTKPSASAAAKKAFLVNRVGDVGFAIAIFWMWTVVKDHNLNYGNVLSVENLAAMPHAAVLGISLLLFWAATAKSAQVPLYVWLPDAMEGPTPVSALIHAATMVTAGVYLVARSTPMIVMVPEVQLLVCAIGCLTALLSASIALTQTDLKRVLAYSTVSQLGFMFMALGAGVGGVAKLAVVAGMFHLFTHAFFKALLFLASGSVMHAMGGIIDMRRFRGLRHRLPWTCWTFAVGGLALSGIPPFAGFFSKDEILVSLKDASHAAEGLGWGGAYTAIYWIAVLTAFMTAFYTGRAFFLTFFGPERLPSPDDPEAEGEAEADAHAAHEHSDAVVSAHGSSHADPGHGHDHGGGHDAHFGHESPPIMIYPLAILAFCAFFVGMVFGPTHWFEHHLERTLGFETIGNPSVMERQVLLNEVAVADAALKRAEDRLARSNRMIEKGTVSKVQNIADRLSRDQKSFTLDQAKARLRTIEQHDAAKAHVEPEPPHGADWPTIVFGTLAGVLGLGLGYLLYAKPSPIPGQLARRLGPLYEASRQKFYVDEFYELVIIRPLWFLAQVCDFLDERLVHGLVQGTAWVPRIFGREVLGPFQNGLIQFYAAVSALGVAALIWILLLS